MFRIIIILIISIPVIIKMIWVVCATFGHGNLHREEKGIIRRAHFLLSKVATDPKQLLNEMPKGIGNQFKGEWALYSCSMTTVALANISILYPSYRDMAIKNMERIIDIALSPEIREYDRMRWNEDPIESLNGNNSHMSYLSHLAWMMGKYKQIGGGDKYDSLYHSFCEAMHRRMLQSPSLNLQTYPFEDIYIPDMLVAIVALHDYSRLNNGKYGKTVDNWMLKARTKWIDYETGLLASYLTEENDDVQIEPNIRGSYSALNCYYLSLVDDVFAKKQYRLLIRHFKQRLPFTGIKEYHDKYYLYQFDIDSGPIIFNLSPSGTTFAIGCSTSLEDKKFRKQLLRTAEIAGHTIRWRNKSHYLLAEFALVGEAIALAMRTSFPQTRII